MPDPENLEPLGNDDDHQPAEPQVQPIHHAPNKAYQEHHAPIDWFSLCSCITFWVCNGFAFVFIVIGFVYLNDCPLQEKIPHNIVAIGFCSLFSSLSFFLGYRLHPLRKYKRTAEITFGIGSALAFIAFVICLANSVYVLKEWEPITYRHCDKDIYMFAMVTSCVALGLLVILIFAIVGGTVWWTCIKKRRFHDLVKKWKPTEKY